MTIPMKQSTAPVLLFCLLMAIALPVFAFAQSAQGDPEDLHFQIINATTGEPGTIERLEIHYSTQRLNPVLDVEPVGNEFTIPSVPIKEIGKYVITAWADGVPYFWSIRGQQLLDGPVTLHVFDTIGDLSDVKISGLNLLLRKGESLVNLEYMLKVENSARPQATVVGRPTIELLVPQGASEFKANYTRGPEPIDIPVSNIGTKKIGLSVPLTTGQNQIRVVCSVPWVEGLNVPVGSNLAVDAWSLLATPENLDIRAMELEPDHSQDIPGYLRFVGPALEAEREFRIEVRGRIPAGAEEDVFETEAPAELADVAQDDQEDKGSSSLPLILSVPIIVILVVLIIRRRRS